MRENQANRTSPSPDRACHDAHTPDAATTAVSLIAVRRNPALLAESPESEAEVIAAADRGVALEDLEPEEPVEPAEPGQPGEDREAGPGTGG